MKKIISIAIFISTLSLWGGFAEDEMLLRELFFGRATVESVGELISKGADVNCSGFAIYQAEPQEGETDMDAPEGTIAYQAVYSEERGIEAIRSKNMFEEEHMDRATPMQILLEAYYYNEENNERTKAIAEVLIANGASIDVARMSEDMSIISLYAEKGNQEMISFLFEKGVNPDYRKILKEELTQYSKISEWKFEGEEGFRYRSELFDSKFCCINWAIGRLLEENSEDETLAEIAMISDRDIIVDRLSSYLKLL